VAAAPKQRCEFLNRTLCPTHRPPPLRRKAANPPPSQSRTHLCGLRTLRIPPHGKALSRLRWVVEVNECIGRFRQLYCNFARRNKPRDLYLRMTEYAEITDSRLQSRVRSRYEVEIAALEGLGFRQLAFKLEARGPFSAVLWLPLLPLMRQAREVLVFPFPLRLALANVLYVHGEPPSIACCMGMGVKLYTNFSDHSLLISSTLPSHADFQDSNRHSNLQIVRTPPCKTPQEAWLAHKRRTSEMQARGNKVGSTSSFADYVAISEREEVDLRSRRA